MRGLVFALALVVSPVARADGFADARAELFHLKKHPSSKRAAYLALQKRFQKLATAGERAPDAAFDAAAARAALYGRSGADADRDEAAALYLRTAERFPKSALADDALLAAAKLTRASAPDTSRESLTTLLQRYPSGDCAPAARALLKELPAPDADDEDADDAVADDASEEDEAPAPRTARAAKPPLEPEPERVHQLATAHLSSASLSEQAGLKIRRIAIDAGHGGKDTGAIGPRGVREKDAALGIAKKLAARLKALGYETLLTRDDDTFVPLSERAEKANDWHADLFVSVHCNAAKKRALTGTETWFLDVANNRYAARLAARENAESERAVSELELILADLATKSNTQDSAHLAAAVQRSMTGTLRRYGKVKDLGVKHALFAVLIGARMPAILVETAFISNKADEQHLKDPKFQDATANAIAQGVKGFVDDRRRVASVN